MGVEKGSDFYDSIFEVSEKYLAHWTESVYIDLWKRSLQRLKRFDTGTILELGCGVGQFIDMMKDSGYHDSKIIGFDFSASALRIAESKKINNTLFIMGNLLDTDVYHSEYDTVICMETLEHITHDLHILDNIKHKTNVLITVPDFDSAGHVRHFLNIKQVTDRYSKFFTDVECEKFEQFYILTGVKK